MINTQNYISFTSRGRVIRKADDIARSVASTFPVVSVSRYSGLPNHKIFFDSLKRTDEILTVVRREMCSAEVASYLSTVDKVKNIFRLISRYKVGNCGEITDISTVFAKLKNLKGVKVARLLNGADQDLDHVVTYIENDGNPYIIDSWLGFADYVPNALQKYKTVYRKYFPIDKGKSQDLKFEKYKYTLITGVIDKMTKEDACELQKELKKYKK